MLAGEIRVWFPETAAMVIVPELVAEVPKVPDVAIEYEILAVGVPEIVIVLLVVFFTKVSPEAGNPVIVASVASPPQVNTIEEIAVPLVTV